MYTTETHKGTPYGQTDTGQTTFKSFLYWNVNVRNFSPTGSKKLIRQLAISRRRNSYSAA
jgi:hypothetical protein